MAITDESSLTIGTIDEIQKLHIRTVPLYETPRRIAYQESTESFGVITLRIDVQKTNGPEPVRASASIIANNTSVSTSKVLSATGSGSADHNIGDEVEVHSVLFLDQQTFSGMVAALPVSFLGRQRLRHVRGCDMSEWPAVVVIVVIFLAVCNGTGCSLHPGKC